MEKKEAKFIHGLIPILVLAVVMFLAVVKLDAEPHLPLIIGTVVAGVIAWKCCGWTWDELLGEAIKGIDQALEAVLILISIGILVSMWIASGTVPTMIYYGLKIVTPKIYLLATFVLCTVISMFVGAWGAAGTVGIAFMGIGTALGTPPALAAGAVIAGAYVGDKMSPFSDGTNLAAAVSGSNIFEMIKKIMPIALPVWVVSAVIYLIVGIRTATGSAEAIASNLAPMMSGLEGSFKLGLLAIIPLVIMIVCVIFKLPSLIAILIGALAGAVVALTVQGCTFAELFSYSSDGFVSETGVAALDSLLSAGGIQAMMRTISIIFVAMAFGGVMQGTGQMEALVRPIVTKVKSVGGMIALTIVTCIGINAVLPDQYLGIAVSGQMYAGEYEKRGLSHNTLGNVLGAGAAVTSPLIPWNTCGAYMTAILGVNALSYAPFAFFNLLLPIVVIIIGFVGGKKAFER